MPTPFQIESTDINRLTDVQLAQLLQQLLLAEAATNGIPLNSVDVAQIITVTDGGEDGRIEWQGEPDSTDFIPQRLTIFQAKASDLGPADYGQELLTKDRALKPRVSEVLDAEGSYIVFTTQGLTGILQARRIEALRVTLETLGKTYARTCDLRIYDSAKIATWVNCHLAVVVQVEAWAGRSTVRGLKNMAMWGRYEDFLRLPFLEAASRSDILNAIRQELPTPHSCLRITGLSGLGKSRTAYQAIIGLPTLQKTVVYIDAEQEPQLGSMVASWLRIGFKAILVVDNCDATTHRQLVREVRHADSRLSLLTMDFSEEDIPAPTISFKLQPMSNTEVRDLLRPVYQDQLPDLDRIVAFAEGFPQMADLLAEARLHDDPRTGRLTDDDLLRRLLWKRSETVDPVRIRILRACALFDIFGFEQNVVAQLAYIASLAQVDIDAAYACVRVYVDRGIINQTGRFARVVPKPLAMRLAADWWSESQVTTQIAMVEGIPENLLEAFCNQIEKMDIQPRVKQLTEQLCGAHGPYGQATGIFNIRGSRLIRSLVHVHPEAVSLAIARAIDGKGKDELLAITNTIRRNLVGALEYLCYHAAYFTQSGWSLLQLAASENENWGNNATGQFKQLFRIFLSGTEAPPDLRFALLDRALALNRVEVDIVVIQALKQAISTGGGSRSVGAEYQGNQAPLMDWSPQIWGEAFAYWDRALAMLLHIMGRGAIQRDQAKAVIGHAIRPLAFSGRTESVDSAIRSVVNSTGRFWPEAMESLTQAKRYEGEDLHEETKLALQGWLDLLAPTGTDLAEQLKILVAVPPWDHRKNASGEYIDMAAEKAKELARTTALDVRQLIEHLDLLLTGEQRQAWTFGREIAVTIADPRDLINATVNKAQAIPKANLSFLRGLLTGLHRVSIPKWDSFLESTIAEGTMTSNYVLLACTGLLTEAHLDRIIELITSGRVEPREATLLSYGSVTDHLTPEILATFCIRLGEAHPEGVWPALNIIYMYGHSDRNRLQSIKSQVRRLVLAVPLDQQQVGGHRDLYHWNELAQEIFKSTDPEFAVAIINQMLAACRIGFQHGDVWHHLKPMMTEMLRTYGDVVWPMISHAIVTETGLMRYWIQKLLEADNGISIKHPGALSVLPTDVVITWCKQNMEVGPLFIASCINVLVDQDGTRLPTPLFIQLLAHFGLDEKVSHTLGVSLYARGWSGSIVPYLQADRKALHPLMEHPESAVRTWTAGMIAALDEQITRESARDAEKHL